MTRRALMAIFAGVLMLGSLGPVGAGGGGPTWSRTPTQGPSPNTIALEGNGCESTTRTAGFSPTGQVAAPSGLVFVALFDKDDQNEFLASEFYDAFSGNWGGPFPIPPGLAPGVYPLKAECNLGGTRESAGITLAQSQGFSYEDLSYTVIAPAEPPEPVESVVTFTG